MRRLQKFAYHRTKYVLILVIWMTFFIFTSAFAQSIEHIQEKTISSEFEQSNIVAYEFHGQKKIKEVFEYLSMYLSGQISPVEKEQIAKALLIEFDGSSNELQVLGKQSQSLSASNWLNQLANEGITIVSTIYLGSQLQDTYWIYNYEITYKKDGSTFNETYHIHMALNQKNKQFGTQTKIVWNQVITSIQRDKK